MKKRTLINEVRQFKKIAGLLKEDRFYAPDYIIQKYGEEKAAEIEQNIFDAEEAENNPNLWDLFASLETPQEVDSFVRGYIEDDSVGDVRLLDFVDNLGVADKYETLGFTVELDDPANRIYSAELSFIGRDALSLLAVLEDCEREGLEPMLIYGDTQYSFREALEFADRLAGQQPNKEFS